MSEHLLSLDQEKKSSRGILFNTNGKIVKQCIKEFKQIYPKPGLQEHDPKEIRKNQIEVAQKIIKDSEIAGIGITDQRETTIVWDKNTSEPVYNAIVWQCRPWKKAVEKFKNWI